MKTSAFIILLFVSLFGTTQNFYNKLISDGTSSITLIDGCESYDDQIMVLMQSQFDRFTDPDQLLVKINNQGDTTMVVNLGTYSLNDFKSVTETDDHGFLIGGNTLLKLDETGNILWNKNYQLPNGLGYKYGRVDTNGSGSVVHASVQEKIYGIPVAGLWNYYNRPAVLSLDANGDTLWTKRLEGTILNSYGTPNSYMPLAIHKTVANEIIAIGILSEMTSQKYIIWKLDMSGNTIFIKEFTGGMSSLDFSGSFERSNGNISFYGISLSSGQGSALLTIDPSGSLVSFRRINTASSGKILGAIELANGDLAIAVENSVEGVLSYQNAVYVTDANLNMIFGVLMGGESIAPGGFVFEHNNGDLVGVTHTDAFNPSTELSIVKMDSLGNTVGCHEVIVPLTTTDLSLVISDLTLTEVSGALYVDSSFSLVNDTVIIYDPSFTITENIVMPNCEGDIGVLDISMNGGTAPFDVLWNNGTVAEDLTEFAGVYDVRVIDNKGCIIRDTFEILEPTALQVSYTTTNVDCFGAANGAIDITSSGGTPGYNYSWSTLATTEDLTSLGGGFYQVIIEDANGCNAILGVAVAEPQQLTAVITGTVNVSCNGLCDGELAGFAAGGTTPYTYQWNDPIAQTNDTALSLCYGNYLLTVTDGNGCNSYSNATVSEPIALSTSVSTWASDCFATNGSAMTNPSGGTGPYTYSWDGAPAVSNDSIGLLAVANYYVDVIDANECITTENFTIGSNTNPVEMCVVTVDANNKNLIVWEKPVATNLAGFNIYRNIAGIYTQVGYQPYDSISQFVDNDFGIDPDVTSYRYKIAVLDSCGNESSLSNFHETIHLTASNGLGGVVNLIWDDYEGFAFSEYEIWRDTTGNGDWETINTVLSTNFTYVDNTVPSSSATLRYAIEVVMPQTCTAEKAQDHNTTRSNRHTIAGPASPTTTINELVLSQAKVYPNPSTGLFNVNMKSDNWSYSLFDMSGKLIATEDVTETHAKVDIESLETGIYMMRITLESNSIYKKIVKQ